jgi:hypothetical protein
MKKTEITLLLKILATLISSILGVMGATHESETEE